MVDITEEVTTNVEIGTVSVLTKNNAIRYTNQMNEHILLPSNGKYFLSLNLFPCSILDKLKFLPENENESTENSLVATNNIENGNVSLPQELNEKIVNVDEENVSENVMVINVQRALKAPDDKTETIVGNSSKYIRLPVWDIDHWKLNEDLLEEQVLEKAFVSSIVLNLSSTASTVHEKFINSSG